tara:strand:+ start:133 stop:300 length:168 start_codon:yes stop_codon:yes gene_type:complete
MYDELTKDQQAMLKESMSKGKTIDWSTGEGIYWIGYKQYELKDLQFKSNVIGKEG